MLSCNIQKESTQKWLSHHISHRKKKVSVSKHWWVNPVLNITFQPTLKYTYLKSGLDYVLWHVSRSEQRPNLRGFCSFAHSLFHSISLSASQYCHWCILGFLANPAAYDLKINIKRSALMKDINSLNVLL